ncbi:MAG TPA: YciI family protein [Vicinamibacterales bacterium]|nr:YciI family protein [Vicinamibacterales bacterium]
MIRTLLFVTLFVPAIALAQPTPPGFSSYVVGMMTRGEAELPAGASAAELQKAHLAHLTAMWEDGLLLASGPIGDRGPLGGVLIFADDRALVETRVAEDPLVKAGGLVVSLTRWMGPSDIGAGYKKWAADNPGTPDQMRTYQLVLMRATPKALPMTPDEQRAHLLHMDAMAKAGHLVTAGPMLEPGDLAGIFVFATGAAEADRLAASDPAVKAGKMSVTRHPWMVAEGVLPKSFKVPVP